MATLLVVDDERDVANAWAKALRLAGHQVQVATDPAAALALSQEHPLDLVILDYMMPTMSGIQLLNEIRKVHPVVRSIIISGKIDLTLSEDIVLSEITANISADLYLHKPVENARLREAVEKLLTSKDTDWHDFASTKLDGPKDKKYVRATEKALNKKKAKRKK